MLPHSRPVYAKLPIFPLSRDSTVPPILPISRIVGKITPLVARARTRRPGRSAYARTHRRFGLVPAALGTRGAGPAGGRLLVAQPARVPHRRRLSPAAGGQVVPLRRAAAGPGAARAEQDRAAGLRRRAGRRAAGAAGRFRLAGAPAPGPDRAARRQDRPGQVRPAAGRRADRRDDRGDGADGGEGQDAGGRGDQRPPRRPQQQGVLRARAGERPRLVPTARA